MVRKDFSLAVEELRGQVAELLELDEIGADDNLIELGMDSITMMRLAGGWRKAGRNVKFADLVTTPTLSAWEKLLADETPEPESAQKSIVDESGTFPLALMQHAYWVGREPGQRLGGVAAHFYHEFDGVGVEPGRLEPAVRAVLARHGMLRVVINDDGTQRIAEPGGWPGLRVHDFREATDLSGLDDLRDRLSHRRLDIGSGEVFDVQLSLLPEGRTRTHVNLDMVAADALSLRVLLADLARAYRGEPLPPLEYSYPRYLAERRRAGAGAGYWQDRLPTMPGAPQLPVAGQLGETARVTRHHRKLTADDVRTLENGARRHGLTTAMALAAVFAETLTAWSAEPRFLLNLPLFDRDPLHPDVDALVGDFTSSVLLEWDGSVPGTFAERARRLQDRFHTDVAYTGYSGVEVLRDLSRAHGEQVLAPVVYTSALGLGELFSREVRECFGDAVWIISQGPQVWLDAQVTELDGGLLVNWDVREDAFVPGVPQAMFDAYGRLLDRLLAGSEAWSALVPSLLPSSQTEVRAVANDTTVERPAHTLHEPFFALAAERPDAPALLWETDGAMSYGELSARALEVAGSLRSCGVEAGDLVAVSLPKGPEQVVAVLGVLAAGCAYAPIGVDQPPARRKRILSSAGVRFVLDSLPSARAPFARPESGTGLAYVIYTSGSTGEPKGVEISHRAAVNTIDDLNARFEIGAEDRTLALSALEFDLSVYDIFGPLSVGGAVICPRDTGRRDATVWAELARRHRATVLNCVPALLDMLMLVSDELPLRVVLLGGDRVTTDLPGRLAARAPGCRFAGLGGTTETAIHSTVLEVEAVDPQWTCVPYGTPLDNVVCRVVDGLGRDRPDWVPGELWIGGAGVALGYRGDPDRTADRFVEVDGTRWYRTGDLARYLPDGTLDFLGRADHQVKLRGHRIELGEIEAAVTEHPEASQAVAVVTEDGRLAVAVVGATEGLTDFLPRRLPMPMLPDVVVALDAFPLTANGKIDRTALRRMLAEHRDERSVTAPEGEIERLVAAAWAEILPVSEIGREHDFFVLGGDSLLATRLIGRLRSEGLTGVSLSALFAAPVLADFAASLQLDKSVVDRGVLVADPENRHEPFPPTPVQRAYWLGRDSGFTLGGIGCHFYREYDVDDLDVSRLEIALDKLIRRHEMLRAVFDERGDQRILAEVPWLPVEVTDEPPEALRESLSHQVFDPSSWPLFTVRGVRRGARTRLAIGMDNLVLDALSILTFYAELSALYENPDVELPPVDMSFRDYVLSTPPPSEAAERYWSERLPTLPPAPRLPLAKEPAEVGVPRFSRRAAVIEAGRWTRITDLAREHGVTPSAVLLSAFSEVVGRWSARADLTLNLTLFDRRAVHPDIGRVMGDFTSLLLVGYRPERGDGWLDRVRRVQEELWAALDHRDVSAVHLRRELARTTGEPEVVMPVVFTSALGFATADADGLFADQVWGVSQTPQVWLDHQVTEVDGGIAINWDAVDELFPPGLLDAMFEAYLKLIDLLVTEDWRAPVADLLPAAQASVREAVNATEGPLPARALHADFFRLAASDPGRVALVGSLTYGELADRALRMASALMSQGAKPGDRIAVVLPKGPEQVVAVLGVLAAGCAYVPVGVDQPPARRNRILKLAGARLAITDDTSRAGTAVAVVPAAAMSFAPLTTPAIPDPDELAYVIFTSGSTGEPKGVEITHRAALNTIDDINARFDVGRDDRVLAVSALDFDLSVYDVFGLLSAGGALVTIDEDARRDARRWHELVTEHGVTIWNTVPALLDMLLVVAPSVPSLRLVLVSGDWVGLDLPGRAGHLRFVALGGATEASIWSNFTEVTEVDPDWRSIPYGKPLRNQAFRVVDDLGRDCPDWVPGELWIGGAGVARGYRGAPDLTADRFVEVGGARWYRTGDLGRYWPDGTLEFLGRRDQQVKIRGYRIELGEVEAALLEVPGVTQAVAAVHGTGADRRLVAAITGESGVDGALADAATRLPAHMVPDRLVVVDRIPLSANGKLDRAAVASLAAPAPVEATEGPRGEWELTVAALWRELLDVETVGRRQNFFTLGGDSLRATRMLETLRQRYDVVLPLRSLFAAPTVEGVARELAALVPEESEEGSL
ncbi:non-ribosomal peptide synthetase [Amycolatopsis regifaucium]|uniref:Phenyloxazoline synthase MbtB n=1 Tax=Amycolatopsis regifaucium TaxID=546365 RepID=A0A154MKU5_9PSEU|nr:non-ribosomal peptide synthetase [Amycolatopsis regifaucium]OKA06950.1 non-ribosomal peptide synthetase [Amycolatopsis regifaucium]